MGYGWLQFALEGDTQHLALGTILALVVLKIVATALTIGSGGSGGVFAPGLFIGGMVGAGLWGCLHGHVPWMPDSPGPFVVVGMMALFGGIAKAPIAVILMVAEMTNEFSMIIPAMLATGLAYLISGEIRIYENQVETRADSPAHSAEYILPLVQLVTVAEAMRTPTETLTPQMDITEARAYLDHTHVRGLPVTNSRKLVGVFTISDALRAEIGHLPSVGDAMTRKVIFAIPNESVHTALTRMTQAGVSRLPVVRPEKPSELLGMIDMADIANALDKQLSLLPPSAYRRTLMSG